MSTTTPERNLLGIPIIGDIQGSTVPTQRPIEDLAPLLQAVLDDPGIEEFGWRQYTPYFMDGDPCVFGIGDIWFLSPEDADDEADQKERREDPYMWAEHHYLHGERGFAETLTTGHWDTEKNRWVSEDVPNPHYDQDRYDRLDALTDAIGSGQFNNALLNAFGDHAIVTINRDNITVEFYEHE